jgi:hypothetical protein
MHISYVYFYYYFHNGSYGRNKAQNIIKIGHVYNFQTQIITPPKKSIFIGLTLTEIFRLPV